MNNQNTNNNHKSTDVYSIVNNRIIELLEKGVVPWHKSWSDSGMPKNLITKKPYKGINVWLLSSMDYEQNYFLTFRQVQDLGGSVKKGEKSHVVVFWKWFEKENEETKEKERVPMLRYYRAFNVSQCDNIPLEKIPKEVERNNNPIEVCEKIINEMPMKPRIQHKTQEAYYNRLEDYINMPRLETFDNNESYYSALFHETLHSTGHSDRLNRKELLESRGMRSEDYAKEELTAEMGASYLKSYAGIPIEQLENNASYIQHWLGHLKNDKRFIMHASAQAQKATDYILNINSDNKELGINEESKNKTNHNNQRKLSKTVLYESKERCKDLQTIREGKINKKICEIEK